MRLRNSQKGFTLIELIVVLAVFVFVIDATVTIFVSVVHHQKRIVDQQEMVNQINYATETLSQSLRNAKSDSTGACLNKTGSTYILTRRAADGFYQGVRFIDSDGLCQEFFLDSDGAVKIVQGDGAPQPLLSEKFQVQYMRFLLNGDKAMIVGKTGVRVTLALNVSTRIDGALENHIVQTTISHRNNIFP